MHLTPQTGKEIWGFVPPLIASSLPTVVNASLNSQKVELMQCSVLMDQL